MTANANSWSADLYTKTINSPFVSEMSEGTLSRERFIHYMTQDVLYLNEYARVLALIGAKAPDLATTSMFAGFSASIHAAERGVHDFYLTEFGAIEKKQKDEGGESNKNDDRSTTDTISSTFSKNEMTPTCHLYTSFLLQHAALSPIEVAAAAVLPCFWIYAKVGRHSSEKAAADPNHRYHKWFSMYSSDDFDEHTQKAIDFCDRLAAGTTPEKRAQMIDAFVLASKMEYMFWDTSYKLEKWEI